MKTLYLVRHAKSSWSEIGLSDRQRPLNKRGMKNAPEMGQRLAAAGVCPDKIISSPAKRAYSTASYLAEAMGFKVKAIVKNDQLYFDGLSAMLNIIQRTDDETESLMLVAHNPDMTSLMNALCGYQVDNMPTCAIATIEFDSSWNDVEFDSGKLVSYDYPKKV